METVITYKVSLIMKTESKTFTLVQSYLLKQIYLSICKSHNKD